METRIYALTDSHQECRNLSAILSGIYNFEKDNTEPFLILDGGDLFKGVYDKNLSVNAYLKIKELLPQANIFLTLGNNDFGFKKEDFEYLKSTVKKFESVGIHFVCANLYETKTDKTAAFLPQYKVIKINGQKILISGFCVNNSCCQKFGYTLKPLCDSYKNLIESIKEEYDKIIILCHHWYPYSKELQEYSKTIGAEINLIIGGHEHSPIPADFERNIFYPLSFARSLYKMKLTKKIENIEQIPLSNFHTIEKLEKPLKIYENKTKLHKPIIKRVLNLTKKYSDPCPLGTFISDNMKELGKTDIAFHSTGFTMYNLSLEDSPYITKYDLDKVICQGSSHICTVELSVDEIKKIFENATKFRMYKNRGNSRFLQCSKNISITGLADNENKTYKILQINIDGENLLDENQNPIDNNRKYSCTLDSYIANGEQGFDILRNLEKKPILNQEKPISLNTLLYNALRQAEKRNYPSGQYPSFKLIDI